MNDDIYLSMLNKTDFVFKILKRFGHSKYDIDKIINTSDRNLINTLRSKQSKIISNLYSLVINYDYMPMHSGDRSAN